MRKDKALSLGPIKTKMDLGSPVGHVKAGRTQRAHVIVATGAILWTWGAKAELHPPTVLA